MDRERPLLLQQTFKQLNQFYGRRYGSVTGGMPIAVHKVKVTFKDEPGEGSGVARSFYAAMAEALASSEKLPNLEGCQVAATNPSPISSSASRMQQRKKFFESTAYIMSLLF